MKTQNKAYVYKNKGFVFINKSLVYKNRAFVLSLVGYKAKFSPAPGKLFFCIRPLFHGQGKGYGYIFRLPNIS